MKVLAFTLVILIAYSPFSMAKESCGRVVRVDTKGIDELYFLLEKSDKSLVGYPVLAPEVGRLLPMVLAALNNPSLTVCVSPQEEATGPVMQISLSKPMR